MTEIGEKAFYYCTSMTSIKIPKLVTEIREYAIHGCTSLKRIIVSPENDSYDAINDVLFEKKTKTLLHYPVGLTDDEYIIPKGIVKIGQNAFSDCSCLTSIEIPELVTEIGDYSFSNCTSLTSINIPESVCSAAAYVAQHLQVEQPTAYKRKNRALDQLKVLLFGKG